MKLPAVRNKANAPCGGVGLILNPKAQELMTNIEKFNDRILIATFAGNPKTTVVVVYSPVEGDSDEIREQFFDNLTTATKAVPKHNFLIVMGDFNAHVGQEDGFKYTYHSKTNKNGHLLINFALELNLIITNSKFQKKRNKLWSFYVLCLDLTTILLNQETVNHPVCDIQWKFLGKLLKIIVHNIELIFP